MKTFRDRLLLGVLHHASLVLFAAVFILLSVLAPRFLDIRNLVNILVQSSSTAIVAIGMTFVLLTAGVDLSVGAIMFVSAAVAGQMALAGWPLWSSLVVILAIGLLYGGINAVCITRFGVLAFVGQIAVRP